MKGVITMSDFKNYLAQQMEDPAFAAEYEAQRPEYEAIRAVIAARLACNMTQKELAEKTGIRQSNISRIENGSASPTIDTLARIAAGLGKQLKIDFV
jgi:DNA-binding XRE family transcriptional regulator